MHWVVRIQIYLEKKQYTRVYEAEEGGHDVTSQLLFAHSDYIPRARITNASYKDGSMDKVTMGVQCFLLS